MRCMVPVPVFPPPSRPVAVAAVGGGRGGGIL